MFRPIHSPRKLIHLEAAIAVGPKNSSNIAFNSTHKYYGISFKITNTIYISLFISIHYVGKNKEIWHHTEKRREAQVGRTLIISTLLSHRDYYITILIKNIEIRVPEGFQFSSTSRFEYAT